MTAARLYIFSGLPGSGKTTLAQRLAADTGATYLRIDTIEQALRDVCGISVAGEGYALAYRVAADNLRLGLPVVADSCNPIELTRRAWEQVAADAGLGFVNVEVTCSNTAEHRRRIETRKNTVANLVAPTWDEVQAREYHNWTRPRVVVDTAGCSPEAAFARLSTLLLPT